MANVVNLDEHNYNDSPVIICPKSIISGDITTIEASGDNEFKCSSVNENLLGKIRDILANSESPVVLQVYRNSDGKLDCCEM